MVAVEKLKQVRESAYRTCLDIQIIKYADEAHQGCKIYGAHNHPPLSSFTLDLIRLKSKLQPYIR